jgi:hypothetical protein
MEISFYIPEYVLWLIGIPIGLFVLIVFIIGLVFTIKLWILNG